MTNFFSRTYHRIRSESAEHVQETRDTYCSHLTKNVRTSFNLVCASVALVIHGVVPAWCKKVGHDIVIREADNMEEPPTYIVTNQDE
jgi:uncharacterized protein YsxB (DUF464 family)